MIRLGDRTVDVATATLELFHLYAEEAGWTFDAHVTGLSEHIAFEGRVRTPALPGPSELVLWYVDAPRVVTIDGEHGTLSAIEPLPRFTVTGLAGGRARIDGMVKLAWTPLSGALARDYVLELALEAALVT